MVDFKKKISDLIKDKINIDVYNYVKQIDDSSKGDYTFPCFALSKELHKSPVDIANELKDSISDESIEKIESVNGYLNIFLNKEYFTKEVFEEYDKLKDNYGFEKNNKNIIIEYSSPNICKPFHIGHLRTTILGNALYNIYKFLGYNTTGINHIGDYGTQFGKLIKAYKLWKDEYDVESDPINELTKMYVRINALCGDDPTVLDECREEFAKLENGDPESVELWKKFSDWSMKEFDKIYKLLNVKFDSIKGEAFYTDKMPEVIDILRSKNKLVESQGAEVVDLSDEGIDTPCIIKKSDGTSIYATRDLAAILYRARTYDFDKCIYVVGSEQIFHFEQVFKVAKYLGLDDKYVNGLIHVPYGLYSLPEGRMSTRKGNFVKLEDILNESITKAKEKVSEKNAELEDINDVAKKVGIGAIIFKGLFDSRSKDIVFNLDEMVSFNGETCPYIQYMYVRIKSILRKCDKEVLINDVKYDKLRNGQSYELVKDIYNFNKILNDVIDKNEPYILTRYLIKLATDYSDFYNNYKVLSDDIDERNSRIYLITVVSEILKTGCNLLGIEMPEKM